MEIPPRIATFRATLGLLALALLAGCGDPGDASDDFERSTPVVEVMRVEAGPLVDVATFSGQLDAEHSVMVKPEIEGVIASIDFEQGQEVSEGDVLFRLRSGEQAARLREAEATRDLAGEDWKRAQQLLTRDASSRAQADVARAEYEIAKARVDLARLELDRTQIRAPFDGVVGLRAVDIGDRVDDETPLVRLDSVDRLQASFGITDIGLPFARTGMSVNIWVRPYPGEKFPGEVFFVSPSLDPRNRRILVKAWIDNQDRRLAPGLFANVDLEIRRIEDAVVVPESAVAQDLQGSYVWVVDDGNTVSRRPIEIGLREQGRVEVVQGLAPGVRIVTAGIHKVSEGEAVRLSSSNLVGQARSAPAEGTLIGEGT
ncbi:MAG: efflux RND transporter periplasmic adaptor subunit [Myxococcota bacterium]